jgi:hypothetical protein
MAGLRVCRASESAAEITRSSAALWAIRHRPSVPSDPSAGSMSCPATGASSATAEAAGAQLPAPCAAASYAHGAVVLATHHEDYFPCPRHDVGR